MNESEMQRVLDNLVEHVVFYDRQMNIRWANRAACDLVGLSPDEIVERRCHKLWAGTDEVCPDCPVVRTLETGRTHEVEKTTPDGRAWFVRGYPIADDDGNITGAVELTLDITGQRHTQEAYRAVVDHSLQGLVIIQDMKIVFANQAMAEISGYGVEEILAAPPRMLEDFVHPEDRRKVWEFHQARLCGEPLPDQYAFRVVRKDGAVRWLEIHTGPVDYKGRPAIQAACIDVTDRVQTEESLRVSERHNRALLDAIPDLMFRLDAQGAFLDYKAGEDNWLYVPPEQFLGRTLAEVMPAEVAGIAMDRLEQVFAEGQTQTVEYQLPTPDGQLHDFECRLVACGDREVLAIVRDVGQRKHAERLGQLQRDLAVKLSSVSSLREGLECCLEAAITASQMDCGGIYSLDEATGGLKLVVHRGLSEEFVNCESAYAGDSRHAALVMQAEPLYGTYDTLSPPLRPGQRREGLRALAVVPIKDEGRVVACMNVASHSVDEIPQGSRVVLETIGAQMGSAISRLKAREALRESEEKFRNLAEQSPNMIFINVGGRVVYANPRCEDVMGYTREEFYAPDFDFQVLMAPEDRDRIGHSFHRHMKGEEVPSGEYTLVTRDGRRIEAILTTKLINYKGDSAVLGIVTDITERKKAEKAMRYRLDFEELVADISNTFVSLPADDIDGGIDQTLEQIGRFVDVDRTYVVMLHDSGTRLSQVHEWCAEGIESYKDHVQGLEVACFSWTAEQFAEGDALSIPCVGDLQGEATRTRELMEAAGVKSLLNVPIVVGGALFGFLGFATVRRHRTWSPDDVLLVKIVAEVFANALARKRSAEALQKRLAFETLVSHLSAAFINLPTEDINAEIERWLGQIGEFLRIDRSTILHVPSDCGDIVTTHSWAAPGLDAAPATLPREEFTWFIEQLVKGETLVFSALEGVGDEAASERRYCERQGIKSLVVIPVVTSGLALGAVVFSSMRKQREWSDELVQRLRLVGEIFANALLRKHAEESLHASEERFRGIFENAVLGFYQTTPDGRLLAANPSLVRMLGYSCFDDIAELNVEQEGFQHGYSRQHFKERIESRGRVVGLESAWRRRDGTTLMVRENARAVRDERGRTLYYEGTVEDITEWKRAERALQESERRYRELYEGSRDGTASMDLEGRIRDCNSVFLNMLGYSLDEIRGVTYKDFTPDRWHAFERNIIQSQVLPRGYSDVYEKEYVRKDGTVLPVELRTYLDRDSEGRPLGMWALVRDISERKEAEAALRASERNYREIFNAANEAIFVHDPLTGAILDVNETTVRMLGYSRQEILQRTVGELSVNEPAYTQQKALERVARAAGENAQLFEWLLRRKDGSRLWVEVNLKSAVIGGKRRVLAVVRDIADRKRAEEEAQRHLSELTRAWHANTLGEMASGLAHELNQPLCAILNYSSGCLRMMRRERFSVEVVRSSIEQISGQAERAANIIKHIRSLMAKRDPHRETLDLNALVVDVMDMLRSEAARREAVMISRFARDLPAVEGNAVELEQVVLNLLRNALEAMNDPEVTQRNLTVTTSRRPDGAVQVAVADTGRGFSAELAEKMFDSFFTTKEEGLGIGLSLSRRIIESHGGRLWAESDGVSGATFIFTLPFEGANRGT